jgi:NAD(P)-dependent dehydrogenase (short-subunit alcohol dehydrogenase family)
MHESSSHNFETLYLQAPEIWNHINLQHLLDFAEEKIGAIYALINCISTRTKQESDFFQPLESYDLEVWREVIDGNLLNTFVLNTAVGNRMAKRNLGSILNFGSIYSSEMAADQRIYNSSNQVKFNTPVPYPVSKGGVIALSKHLASYWGEFNVRVNTISPGGVYNHHSEEFINAYSSRVPLRRMAEVAEISGVAVFLVSPLASYITGQNILVDGGLSAW